jgi:helix-turn-helix protein
MDRGNKGSATTTFPRRLKLLAAEFGSRYALAKSSRIPASTLQSYEAGSKPGIDALTKLARAANVDLNWLATGDGKMRPEGLPSGASLADVVVVDQYEMGTALSMSVIVGQVPFSRQFLESRIRLKAADSGSLLAVEADANLLAVSRGDLVLIDRNQKDLGRDAIYLLDLPGLVLRAVTRFVGDRVRVMGPSETGRSLERGRRRDLPEASVEEVDRSDLLGAGRCRVSKVVGRAAWIGRAL